MPYFFCVIRQGLGRLNFRTFITLSAECGMSVNSIAKLTGKTVKVLIENYLVESPEVADQEMEKAWGASPPKG